jgi:hypothetical protein
MLASGCLISESVCSPQEAKRKFGIYACGCKTRHQWMKTSSMRGNVTYGWMNVMYDPQQRFLLSVVIYDKHVIYACAPSRRTRVEPACCSG